MSNTSFYRGGPVPPNGVDTAEALLDQMVSQNQDFLDQFNAYVNTMIRRGTDTPEHSVAAPVGTLYLRIDGGAGTTLYVKESGTGDTGWVGK